MRRGDGWNRNVGQDRTDAGVNRRLSKYAGEVVADLHQSPRGPSQLPGAGIDVCPVRILGKRQIVVIQIRRRPTRLGASHHLRDSSIGGVLISFITRIPCFIGIFNVYVEIRAKRRIRNAVDRVAVLDQTRELLDVIVIGLRRNVNPHVGMDRVGQFDRVFPGNTFRLTIGIHGAVEVQQRRRLSLRGVAGHGTRGPRGNWAVIGLRPIHESQHRRAQRLQETDVRGCKNRRVGRAISRANELNVGRPGAGVRYGHCNASAAGHRDACGVKPGRCVIGCGSERRAAESHGRLLGINHRQGINPRIE